MDAGVGCVSRISFYSIYSLKKDESNIILYHVLVAPFRVLNASVVLTAVTSDSHGVLMIPFDGI